MALREINLIPAEILDRQHLVRHVCFWTGCLVTSLALIFGIYLFQRQAVMTEKRALTKLKETHKHLGSRIEEIKRIQKKLDSLIQQRSVLDNITGSQPYSPVLIKLADIINEDTWLTQLALNRNKDTGGSANMQLTGFSRSNMDLGTFLNRLSSEPMFKEVVLKFAREIKVAESSESAPASSSLTQIAFQVECTLQKIVIVHRRKNI